MRFLSEHKNNYKYLFNVIDIFFKVRNSIPLWSKTGSAVTSAFESILSRTKHRPIWVRTDKGKTFLNATFQSLIKREGIQFQVCMNPDVK
jgi:transposase InsO family protein